MPARQTLALYGALLAVSAVLLFPFYWVLSSSVKSRDGMTLSPPAFYPAEVHTERVSVEGTDRIYTAGGHRWLRLLPSPDLFADPSSDAAGAYYVRLDGDTPSQLVSWLADTDAAPADGPDRVDFPPLPVRRIEADDRRVVIAAKMVRGSGGDSAELAFALPAGGGGGEFELLRDAAHSETRRWAPRWANYTETLAGPEASFGGTSTGFLLFMRNSFFISLMAVLGTVLSSSLVAFAFARLDFKGSRLFFVLLLATMMIPALSP